MTGHRRAQIGALAIVVAVGLLAACSSDSSSSDTTTTTVPKLVTVSLGDSFSSGEGAAPYDATSGACKRSSLGWVRRLDHDARAIASLDHRACSGATTARLTGPWPERNLPPQLPTTPDPKVTLVTLTVGGNDIGFSGIVAACFLADCSDIPGNGIFEAGLRNLASALTDTVYPAIETAYPNARIVHVGYPRLTPAAGKDVTGCDWLTTKEQAAAAEIVADLNGAIRRAATTAGKPVTFVSTYEALAGHELCTSSPWVNPVALGAKSQAHPTAKGQRALELAVAKRLKLALR